MSEDFLGYDPIDGQGLESRDVRDHQRKRMIEGGALDVSKGDIQRGGPGALDVGLGFVDVFEVQIDPQRGTRDEYLSPTAAYVGGVD